MQTFIRYLIEKRSNPDKNIRIDAFSQLEKHANNADGLYASYTSVDKIGINPRSHYATPNGIYVYHVKYMLNRMRERNIRDVPFAGNQPHVWIIKPTMPVLVLQEYTEQQLERDKQKLKNALSKKVPFLDQYIEQYQKEARRPTPGGIIWNITRGISSNPNNWNYILRVILGYNIIRDDGDGIIHPAEPFQGVFLSVKALNVVDKIANNKSNDRDVEFAKDNAGSIQQLARTIVELCHQFLKFEKLEDFKNLITKMQYAIDAHGSFKINKALGSKLYEKLKNKLFSFRNPYYIIKFGQLVTDRTVLEEIAKNVDTALKFAKESKGRFRIGEDIISKDKKASIEYIKLIDDIAYIYAPMVAIEGEGDDSPWTKICVNALNDEQTIQRQRMKYGPNVLNNLKKKFYNHDIPALDKALSMHGINEVFYDSVQEFMRKPSADALKKIVELSDDSSVVSYMKTIDLSKILDKVAVNSYNKNGLMQYAHMLIRKFQNVDIRLDVKKNLFIVALTNIKHAVEADENIKVINEILHSSEINGNLTEFTDTIYHVIDSFYPDFAGLAYKHLKHYVDQLMNSNEGEAVMKSINKLYDITDE